MSLFNTHSSRPDDIIEGNFPKLNREKVPEKILYYLLYCQSLGFAEVPNYSGLKKLFNHNELKKLGSVAAVPFIPTECSGADSGLADSAESKYTQMTIKQSNAHGVPDWLRARLSTHCCVPEEHRHNKSHIPDKVPSTDILHAMLRSQQQSGHQTKSSFGQKSSLNTNNLGDHNIAWGSNQNSPQKPLKDPSLMNHMMREETYTLGCNESDIVVRDAMSPLDDLQHGGKETSTLFDRENKAQVLRGNGLWGTSKKAYKGRPSSRN